MTLDPQQFLERHDAIAVGLNRQRFMAEAWPVEEIEITDRQTLGTLYTAFRTSFGRINGHFLHWLGSRQMRLALVTRRFRHVPDPDRTAILAIQQDFEATPGQIALRLPAYRAPDGIFLMDGNHRATALYLSGRPFTLTLDCIDGPIDPAALTDIVHCRR